MVIKSGVRFLILFVLVDAILLSLDLKKSPSYDLKNFDDFEYSLLRRFQKYLVCECSLIFLFILKLNHSAWGPGGTRGGHGGAAPGGQPQISSIQRISVT